MIIQVTAYLFTAMLMLMFVMYDITQLRFTYYIRKIQAGQLTILIWCLVVVFKIIAPNQQLGIIFSVLSNITLLFVAYFVFQFTYVVQYSIHPRLNTLRIVLFIPVVASLAFIISGILEINACANSTFFRLMIDLIALIYYITGSIYFVANLVTSRDIQKRQKVTYFVTVIITTLFIYMIAFLEAFKINVEIVVGFLPLYFIMFIWITRHFRLHDPMPTLINTILEHRDYSIIVLDRHLDVVDYNTSFIANLVEIRECKGIQQIINKLEPYMISLRAGEDLYRRIAVSDNNTIKGELRLVVEDKETILSYYCSSIYGSKERKIATLITFRNLTEQVMIQRSIEQNNKVLEKANTQLREHLQQAVYLSAEAERERMMKEINHVFGHTMTEILSMLEVDYMMLEQEEEDERIEMRIDATLTRARGGLNEIRGLVSKYKKGGDSND